MFIHSYRTWGHDECLRIMSEILLNLIPFQVLNEIHQKWTRSKVHIANIKMLACMMLQTTVGL